MYNFPWRPRARQAALLAVTVTTLPLLAGCPARGVNATTTGTVAVSPECSRIQNPRQRSRCEVDAGRTQAQPASRSNPKATWNSEQLANAALIVQVGKERGVPRRGHVVALATAMQESSLRNGACCDHDSLGLFQQRPSMGWGTPAQVRDPRYATNKFYDKLLQVRGWQTMPVWMAAQAVQRSAFPMAYDKWVNDAERLAG